MKRMKTSAKANGESAAQVSAVCPGKVCKLANMNYLFQSATLENCE